MSPNQGEAGSAPARRPVGRCRSSFCNTHKRASRSHKPAVFCDTAPPREEAGDGSTRSAAGGCLGGAVAARAFMAAPSGSLLGIGPPRFRGRKNAASCSGCCRPLVCVDSTRRAWASVRETSRGYIPVSCDLNTSTAMVIPRYIEINHLELNCFSSRWHTTQPKNRTIYCVRRPRRT